MYKAPYYFIALAFLLSGLSLASIARQQTPANPEAVQWLTSNLENYFLDKTTMEAITTKQYTEFKIDAMNAGMDSGMPEASFHRKWQKVYNTRQQGIHEGFLIPLQDWDKVTVQCSLLSGQKSPYQIAAMLTEQGSRQQFKLNIKVIRVKDEYKIDDVQLLQE